MGPLKRDESGLTFRSGLEAVAGCGLLVLAFLLLFVFVPLLAR